jgi:hypothetical protein
VERRAYANADADADADERTLPTSPRAHGVNPCEALLTSAHTTHRQLLAHGRCGERSQSRSRTSAGGRFAHWDIGA